VGVLATRQTIASPRFARLAETWANGARILAQPCPGLVEQIERGELATEKTRQLVASFVRPLVEEGADTLVLGCTHYPFVEPLIAAIAGPAVTLINPSAAVARELRRRLTEAMLLAPGPPAGSARSELRRARGGDDNTASPAEAGLHEGGITRFVTSGSPPQLSAMLAMLGIESGPVAAL
jgi:glutamate racemase